MTAKSSKILLTGGAGFIGRELTKRLSSDGWCVTVLDDLSSLNSKSPTSSDVFIHASVVDLDAVLFAARGCSVIVHLAEIVGVRRNLRDPIRSFVASVAGLDNVCAAADQSGCAIVYASSSEVYGVDSVPPFAEDGPTGLRHLPAGRALYPLAKVVGEEYLLTKRERASTNVTVARLFNTCGPGQHPASGMVLPRFVDAAKRGVPLTVFGDGHQTRTFLHVRDCADALAKMVCAVTSPQVDGQVFNVGGIGEISMLDLALLVRTQTDSGSSITHVSYEEAYDTPTSIRGDECLS